MSLFSIQAMMMNEMLLLTVHDAIRKLSAYAINSYLLLSSMSAIMLINAQESHYPYVVLSHDHNTLKVTMNTFLFFQVSLQYVEFIAVFYRSAFMYICVQCLMYMYL